MIKIIGPALNQWDTGRVVHITGTEAEHAHFANKGDSKAVIMGVVDTEAKIPDFLLQTGKQLCVYAVKDGITVESKVFYVNTREQPENYVYDDDQRNYIYELISKAETAIEGAYSAYENANHAVAAANTAIVSANVAVENANESANSAKQAAKNANEAADKANHATKDAVKTVNGIAPDENGNVEVDVGSAEPGKNGVSATHEWNGTVLTITSASGTSSADLKGEKGDPGKDYTLTEADKQEIAEQAAGMVEIPAGGGFVASDTPPEDTSLLWVDTSDNSGGGSNVDFPTDEHINALIDAKLGVIENGTY